MVHTLTDSQKRLIQELLKVGRWNNESEIVRYGLHLVAKEVEIDQQRSLEPYSAGVVTRTYARTQRATRDGARLGGTTKGRTRMNPGKPGSGNSRTARTLQ